MYLCKYMEMVATSPTPRSAVTRHQRVRNAVWSDSRQTTRRAIPRHETTRIVVDIGAHTCVCNFFWKSCIGDNITCGTRIQNQMYSTSVVH